MEKDTKCYEVESVPASVSFEGFFGNTLKFNLELSQEEFDRLWDVLGDIIHKQCKEIREKK